jgi:hypothetical protein
MFKPSAQLAHSPGLSQLVLRLWTFFWWVVVAGLDLVQGMPLHPIEVVVAVVLVVANATSGLVLISLGLPKASLSELVVLVVLVSLLIPHQATLGQLAQPLPLQIFVLTEETLGLVGLPPVAQLAQAAHPLCFLTQPLAVIVEQLEILQWGQVGQFLIVIPFLDQVVAVVLVVLLM